MVLGVLASRGLLPGRAVIFRVSGYRIAARSGWTVNVLMIEHVFENRPLATRAPVRIPDPATYQASRPLARVCTNKIAGISLGAWRPNRWDSAHVVSFERCVAIPESASPASGDV
jgi:hypothetical protein